MVVTVILFFCLVMADQVLKFVVERIALNDTLVLIPNFLELRLTYNPGMAWGALGNNTLLLILIFPSSISFNIFILDFEVIVANALSIL